MTSPNPNDTSLYVGGDIYGSAHHHTIKGHEIPSFGDLEQLVDMYKKATTPNKNIVVSIIVCKAGNTINIYALKVNDITALDDAIKTTYNNPKLSGLTLDLKKKKLLENEGKEYDECNGEYEKIFLTKFKRYGISLYKTDVNMQNWNELGLSSPDPLYPNTNTVIINKTLCEQK